MYFLLQEFDAVRIIGAEEEGCVGGLCVHLFLDCIASAAAAIIIIIIITLSTLFFAVYSSIDMWFLSLDVNDDGEKVWFIRIVYKLFVLRVHIQHAWKRKGVCVIDAGRVLNVIMLIHLRHARHDRQWVKPDGGLLVHDFCGEKEYSHSRHGLAIEFEAKDTSAIAASLDTQRVLLQIHVTLDFDGLPFLRSRQNGLPRNSRHLVRVEGQVRIQSVPQQRSNLVLGDSRVPLHGQPACGGHVCLIGLRIKEGSHEGMYTSPPRSFCRYFSLFLSLSLLPWLSLMLVPESSSRDLVGLNRSVNQYIDASSEIVREGTVVTIVM